MIFDPLTLAMGAVAGLVAGAVGLVGGFVLLRLLLRRQMREFEEGVRAVEAASDRYDAAYTRAEVARIYERVG